MSKNNIYLSIIVQRNNDDETSYTYLVVRSTCSSYYLKWVSFYTLKKKIQIFKCVYLLNTYTLLWIMCLYLLLNSILCIKCF